MATESKTSLGNEHFSNDDYFVIITSCSHSILLAKYTTNWSMVGAPLRQIWRMKDLLMCVLVVVFETINWKISRCCFTDSVKTIG